MPAGGVNAFGLTQYDYQDSFFGGTPVLSQGVGYAIVVGFGALFSVFTSMIVWIDYKYGGTQHSSEQFNTAGRSIKVGLTAADIVSKWTWAATLLQSSNVAYKFGVSGPFWYASGATVQVLLFGILAVEVKRKAPRAHTILEIIKARWGLVAHKVFFVFCIATNCIVTGMLMLGGASVMNALTGMDIYAASFLIPIGVIAYTAVGGLKATFLASYIHTVYIYVILLVFAFAVYATNSTLGSPSKVWNNLNVEASVKPVDGNKEGSYLTMFSHSGLVFGIVNLIGNFGTVFVDQAYWQSAIAARPSATYKGYMLGGLCWFAIPFTLATTMGLAANALDLPITIDESNEGLVPPAVAVFLYGNGGAIALAIMLFMAVTSSGSAELIAVSSLLTYDIYREYINPKASGALLVRIAQCSVVVVGCLMGVLAVILQVAGVSLGWVYVMMGCVIGSAVPPIAMALTWSKCTAWAAITGAVTGLVAAIITWLVWAQVEYGVINLDSTGSDYPVLAGNLMAIVLSGVICIVMSMMNPDNYDWKTTREIGMIEEDGTDKLPATGEDSAEAMDKAKRFILIWGSVISLLLFVLWPLLALPAGVFSESYFTFWVILSIIWGLVAAFCISCLPPYESRATSWRVLLHVFACKPPTDESIRAGQAYNVTEADVEAKKDVAAV